MGIASGCLPLHAQEAPQTITADDATPQSSAPTAAERDVSYRTWPRNFLQDQKDIWLFPVQLAKGHQLLPTLAVTGVTAALIVADPHDTGHFRRTTTFKTFNNVFSGPITAGEIAIVPAAFLVFGHFRHDSYAEKTALLAGEAYADSAVLDVVLKVATRRLRPSDIPPSGPFNDTFFNSHVSAAGINTSFLPVTPPPRLPLPPYSHIAIAAIGGCPGWLMARPPSSPFPASPIKPTSPRTHSSEPPWASPFQSSPSCDRASQATRRPVANSS
jgi:hypothetical protein